MVKSRLTGGGPDMNKNVGVGVRGGSRTTQAVSVAGLSQLGTAQGGRIKGSGSYSGVNSARNVFEGNKQAATPMGNAVAASTKAGPGGSRTVYRSRTNAVHGPTVGAPVQGRAIWPEYPPETTSRSSLVHKR